MQGSEGAPCEWRMQGQWGRTLIVSLFVAFGPSFLGWFLNAGAASSLVNLQCPVSARAQGPFFSVPTMPPCFVPQLSVLSTLMSSPASWAVIGGSYEFTSGVLVQPKVNIE